MVALVAGMIAISAIYFVSTSATKHFHEQQRVAHTQMSLRMAMQQIRSDIARAGFMGTPNSTTEQNCVLPVTQITGIALIDDVDSSNLTLDAINNVTADGLQLTGNYVTGDNYLVRNFVAGGGGIAFQFDPGQPAWQDFRRSFGVPYDAALFNATFAPGRWVHITTPTGNHFFNQINAVNGGTSPPTITVAPALPVGGTCAGTGAGAEVAPISRIEYRVVDMTGDLASLANPAAVLAGVNGPVLIRREINIATGAVIAGSTRVVAEYVAEFNVDFIVDTAPGAGAPVLTQVNDAAAQAALAGTPENARTAMVRLSVRTAAEDPQFPFVARGAGAPLTHYDLDAVAVGSARVRTARAEVFLPNFQ